MKKVVEVIKNGGVVILPTDTVYGIFTLFGNEDGLRRIYSIKNRQPDKPLAVLIPNTGCVWKWVEKSRELEEVCDKYWPGATTLIMQTREGKTIGLRIPDYRPIIEIMKITGPLYATSANISGEKAPQILKEIPNTIKKGCDLVEDFPSSPSGSPSRIIDISHEDRTVLRD